jgi:hypothetical protein
MDTSLYDPIIGLMVERGVFFNPTLTRTAINLMPKKREWSREALRFLEDPSWTFIPKARRDFWLQEARDSLAAPEHANSRTTEGLAKLQEFVRRFVHAGGKLITGPDTGSSSGPTNLPGHSMHLEMEALVDAGVTPMQAIMASTKWSAELLGQEANFGTIEPGKLADLILVEGDPLADIKATRNVRTVIMEGKVIDTALDPAFRNPMPRPVALTSVLEYMGPQISSIAPKLARQGARSVTLELKGRNFTPSSFLRFDTTDVKAEFISDSKLTATLDGFLLAHVGTFQVTVVNPGSGGGTSNGIYFVIDFAGGE